MAVTVAVAVAVAVEAGGLSRASSGAELLPASEGVGTHLETTHRVQSQTAPVKGLEDP